ncbi:MAG: hypothetical protein GWQ05_12940 [Verrucomicrobiaceae bacterium]|nr:hypothetical protein [Verrucomicrobiaceae bacterium]
MISARINKLVKSDLGHDARHRIYFVATVAGSGVDGFIENKHSGNQPFHY